MLALNGCIDRIDLGFDLHPDARTILLRMSDAVLYALPAGEIDLVSQDAPEEAVILSQAIEELQLEGVAEDDPDAPRALPSSLYALARTGVAGGVVTWRSIEPTIRLPAFRPEGCSPI